MSCGTSEPSPYVACGMAASATHRTVATMQKSTRRLVQSDTVATRHLLLDSRMSCSVRQHHDRRGNAVPMPLNFELHSHYTARYTRRGVARVAPRVALHQWRVVAWNVHTLQ